MRTCIAAAGLILILGSLFGDSLQAGAIYQYVGKDGRVVFTDNPPPGVNAQPLSKIRNMTADPKRIPEKRKADSLETDPRRTERGEKIEAARQDYEQAQKDLENYSLQKNRSGDPHLWWQWNNRIEEQNRIIEEKKRKLDALELAP